MTAKPKNKGGRPTKFNDQLAGKILGRIAVGESVRSICADPAMPSADTIYRWIGEKPEFSERYARAKEDSADSLIEAMFGAAYDEETDVQRLKLRVDTTKWYLSKIKPKKYGDRTIHAGDESAPIAVTEVKRVIIDS